MYICIQDQCCRDMKLSNTCPSPRNQAEISSSEPKKSLPRNQAEIFPLNQAEIPYLDIVISHYAGWMLVSSTSPSPSPAHI